MIGYSRYTPHRRTLERLAPELAFFDSAESALSNVEEVCARRARGEPLVVWEWAPDEVFAAWGPPDLVLSNGFFPHYATVSWDRRGWVASAAWPKVALKPASPANRATLADWIADYRRTVRAPKGNPARPRRLLSFTHRTIAGGARLRLPTQPGAEASTVPRRPPWRP